MCVNVQNIQGQGFANFEVKLFRSNANDYKVDNAGNEAKEQSINDLVLLVVEPKATIVTKRSQKSNNVQATGCRPRMKIKLRSII